MEFGLVGLDGFLGSEPTIAAAAAPTDPDHTHQKCLGSDLFKQDRSGRSSSSDENHDLKISNMSKTDNDLLLSRIIMPLLRSDAFSEQEELMLSFSSPKSEPSFLVKDNAGLLGKNSQSSVFPHFQPKPCAYTRNGGYDCGILSSSMHGAFSGFRGPFSPSQWMELENQALIYKYLTLNVPVPSNLLIPLKKSFYPYGLFGSSAGYQVPNSVGWGPFHLGFSSNTDPEPGRCRRTDGKKWRCSRDAVADQKYCERHINRGRHRSRKPVEGQTGHKALLSGGTGITTTSHHHHPTASVLPRSSPVGTTSGAGPNSLGLMQNQYKKLQPGFSGNNQSNDGIVSNRIRDPQSLTMIPSTINNIISNESSKLEQESSKSEFGFVSTDSLINPFLEFNDQVITQNQHSLYQFTDHLKSDWTQLSMSTSSSTTQKLALSPLKLSQEFEPVSRDGPISWGPPTIGGPLGEVLNSSTNLNFSYSEKWNVSPRIGSSPTGVLQKPTLCSLSNSSSGSSLRGENRKAIDRDGFYEEVLGSTLACCSSSIPSL